MHHCCTRGAGDIQSFEVSLETQTVSVETVMSAEHTGAIVKKAGKVSDPTTRYITSPHCPLRELRSGCV